MKKNQKPKILAYPLKLHYTENTTGGDICEGDEDSDWPSHEDYITETDFQFLSYAGEPEEIDEIPLLQERYSEDVLYTLENPAENPHMFLTIVKFFDGGTFGRSCGYWVVAYVGTDRLAAERVRKAVEDKTFERGNSYLPWTGYFAGLEGTEVILLPVTVDKKS